MVEIDIVRRNHDVPDTPPTRAQEECAPQATPIGRDMIELWLQAFHHIRQLRQKIVEKPSKVFFYPSAGFDWNPLVLFGWCCETFVFCDPNRRPGEFEQEIRSVRSLDGLALGAVKSINLSDLQLNRAASSSRAALSLEERAQGEGRRQPPSAGGGWARYVQLTQIHGSAPRHLRLYYLGTEGHGAYMNLFTNHRAAPKVLCLKGVHDSDLSWMPLLKSETPLGLPATALNKPEILVVPHPPEAPFESAENWPWRMHLRTYPSWQAAAYAAQHSRSSGL